MAEGTVGLFAGEVGEFRGKPAAHPSRLRAGGGLRGDPARTHGSAAASSRSTRRRRRWRRGASSRRSACASTGVDPIDDPLPDDVRDARGLPDVRTAFEEIHRPRAKEQWQRARDRFRFEEAFVLQTVFAQRRHALERDPATARPAVAGGLRERFAERLPFVLTDGQKEVADAIGVRPRTHPPDAPAPAGRGRLGQDRRRAARDAAGRRRRRPGGAARSHRGARLAAPPRHHRTAGRPRAGRHARGSRRTRPGYSCSPARSAPRRARRRWTTPRPARPASSSARTR